MPGIVRLCDVEQGKDIMTPEEFIKAGKTLYEKNWQKSFARDLQLSYPSIWRYSSGRYPIPKKVELAIKHLQMLKKKPPK